MRKADLGLGELTMRRRLDGMVLSYVSTLSSSPTAVVFILAAVMILLGMFVDSLIVLLVFAPVAVSVTKMYGLDRSKSAS